MKNFKMATKELRVLLHGVSLQLCWPQTQDAALETNETLIMQSYRDSMAQSAHSTEHGVCS